MCTGQFNISLPQTQILLYVSGNLAKPLKILIRTTKKLWFGSLEIPTGKATNPAETIFSYFPSYQSQGHKSYNAKCHS